MKINLENKIILGIFILFTLLIFKNWFSFSEIASGDAPFYYGFALKDLTFSPYLWSHAGLGYMIGFLYAFPYLFFPLKILSLINIPWVVIERVVWYFPFLTIAIFSSVVFIKTIFPDLKFKIFGLFVYVLNSYILIIISGGQISVALSYAIAPLVIALFILLTKKNGLWITLLCSLVSALQISFEPRIFMLTLGIVYSYYLFNFGFLIKKYLYTIPVLIIVICLHFYWIYPTIIMILTGPKIDFFRPEVSSSNWLDFLSFAKLSKSISLLHPNWPENIFGKSNFMQAEFLIIPILAYSSLFFVNQQKKNKLSIIYFCLLGLFGSFLAKGINQPFGAVYRFLFYHLPGFNMFRDPTKFYLLIAISYCILIPFSIEQIYFQIKKIIHSLRSVNKRLFFIKYLSSIFLLLVTCCFLLLIKPAWKGQILGSLKAKTVPQEYLAIENFISGQKEFFRTLWLPGKHRFSYFDNNHPAVSAYEVFGTNDVNKIIAILKNNKVENQLTSLSFKYLLIPYDPEGEFFSKDWKFDPQGRNLFEKKLDQIDFLVYKKTFGRITLYEIKNPKNHFWLELKGNVEYNMINPTKYNIKIKQTEKNILIYNDQYNPYWTLTTDNKIINSQPFKTGTDNYIMINSFPLNKINFQSAVLEFLPQKYIFPGITVSLLSLVLTISLLIKTGINKL